MNRPHITQDERDRAILMVMDKLQFRMEQCYLTVCHNDAIMVVQ